MSVSKMQKWTILLDRQYQEQVLETLQEHQGFEPIDWQDDSGVVGRLTLDQTIQEKDVLLKDILQAQQVLKRYASKKQVTKRFSLTYDELRALLQQIEDRDVFKQVQSISSTKQSLQKRVAALRDKEEDLIKWKNLPFLPSKLKTFRALHAFVGVLPQLKTDEAIVQLQEHESLVVETLFNTALEKGVVVYCDKSDQEEVESVLHQLQFTPYKYPYAHLPQEEIVIVREKIDQCVSQQQECEQSLKKLAENYEDLLLLEEHITNEKHRLHAQSVMAQGHTIVAFTGWVSAQDEASFKELLNDKLPKDAITYFKDTVQDFEQEDVPIVLNNHPLIEPFELLTEMYSLPKYSEVDPTPLLAPFYAVFFGMMVADIGYGLLMLIGTWIALKYMSFNKGMRKNLKLFHILSYPTILWGMFFGSFFSVELPFKVLSTSTDAMSLLIISVVFGVIQLLFGLFVNTTIHTQAKNYSTAFSDGLGWIGLIIGIVLIVLSPVVNLPWLATVGNVMIIVNVVGIIVSTMLGSDNKLAGIGSGLYKLYGASGYIGDLASYTRLMALCVAGASIGSSFNLIIGLLPPVARFSVGILLFIVLQGLNFALALLGAYVHGIRLQFVEFFGKFYEGGGRKMKPLKTLEKYVDLKQEYLEEK